MWILLLIKEWFCSSACAVADLCGTNRLFPLQCHWFLCSFTEPNCLWGFLCQMCLKLCYKHIQITICKLCISMKQALKRFCRSRGQLRLTPPHTPPKKKTQPCLFKWLTGHARVRWVPQMKSEIMSSFYMCACSAV